MFRNVEGNKSEIRRHSVIAVEYQHRGLQYIQFHLVMHGRKKQNSLIVDMKNNETEVIVTFYTNYLSYGVPGRILETSLKVIKNYVCKHYTLG